jgi:hypothetical protein
MPKPRPPKPTWEARAADVLAGRAVDPGDLIDLIHEVNPTGRGRGAEETEARYALKSRLQSVLVHRFKADLEVAPDPKDPAVVAIRHRYRRHDACHAVIRSLDDDARSWVQRELDLAAHGGGAAPAAAGSSPGRRAPPPAAAEVDEDDDDRSADELIAAGEEAQAAYDYDRAQQCFSRAVTASGGAPAAAIAFLSFAVDALAADADALDVERRLPAATIADPSVALLLALAAARSGDDDRALRHIARARDARAAEVYALLARRAIDAGDADRAGRLLRQAEEKDPAHPDLRGLADAIAALRASERAPREAALAALVAEGRDAEALAEGAAILARWPESEPARRAVRQVEERQRAGEGKRHLAAAEEAAQRGETAAAIELVHRALTCPLAPAERQAALRRVADLEAALRGKEARKKVEQVVGLLVEADRARGLAAYADLDDALRAEVRAVVPLPVLEWMDKVRAGGRVRAAVEAVLALDRAAAIADRDPAGAAAIIAAHERMLEEVPLARSIEQRARAAAAEDQRRRAVLALREAEEALAGDHFGRAREILDRLDPRALPEADRARVAVLDAAVAAAEERHRMVKRFERLRAAGSFAAARAAAGDLAARSEGADRDRWTGEAEAVADHVRRRYGVKVEDQAGGPGLCTFPGFTRFRVTTKAWVQDGGRHMIVCTIAHAWMFLRLLDIETGRVWKSVQIALDEPMDDAAILYHPAGLYVVGRSGLFELSYPGFELVRRFERNWNRDLGLCFVDGILPPGSRMLWAKYDDLDGADAPVRLVDVDGELGGKNLPDVTTLGFVPGTKEPRLFIVRTTGDWDEGEHYPIVFSDAAGTHLGRVDVRGEPLEIAAHPSGAGTVVLGVERDAKYNHRLFVREVNERLEVYASHQLLLDFGFEHHAFMVPSLGNGMVYVVYRPKQGDDVLMALRSTGPGAPMVEAWQRPVPGRILLTHDTSGRRAFAVLDHAEGIQVAELGAEPPDLVACGNVHVGEGPLEHRTWCLGTSDDNSKAINVYVELRKLDPAARPAAIRRLEAEAGDDPEALVKVFHAVVHGAWHDDASRIIARLMERHADHPRAQLARLTHLAARSAYADLLRELEALGPDRFGPGTIEHYRHLAVATRAYLGDLDGARRELALLDEVAKPGSNCLFQIRTLRDTLAALAEPVTDEDLALDRPTIRQHHAVLRAADARLAAGDPAGAVAILDRPLVWDLQEAQSLARIAAAYLDIAAETPGDRLRKALALATFVSCASRTFAGDRHELLAPGFAYGEERIAALVSASIAWLEADHGLPRAESWLRD